VCRNRVLCTGCIFKACYCETTSYEFCKKVPWNAISTEPKKCRTNKKSSKECTRYPLLHAHHTRTCTCWRADLGRSSTPATRVVSHDFLRHCYRTFPRLHIFALSTEETVTYYEGGVVCVCVDVFSSSGALKGKGHNTSTVTTCSPTRGHLHHAP
jgi:hypothetical protein